MVCEVVSKSITAWQITEGYVAIIVTEMLEASAFRRIPRKRSGFSRFRFDRASSEDASARVRAKVSLRGVLLHEGNAHRGKYNM